MASFLPLSYLFDFTLPDFEVLEDPDQTIQLLKEVVELCGFNVVNSSYYKFQPQGLTAMLLLAESHISIHTWPEKSLFSIDIFTCKGPVDLEPVIKLMKRQLKGLELIGSQEVKRSFHLVPALI